MKYQVVMKMYDGTENEEIVYLSESFDKCLAYLLAVRQTLIRFSPYQTYESDEFGFIARSPLVSQPDFKMVIEEMNDGSME